MTAEPFRRIVLPGEPLVDGPTALRPWRDTDAEALATLGRDAQIARWTRVPADFGVTDARNYLTMRHDAAHAGLTAGFAITETGDARPGDGRLLGSISLLRFAWRHRRGEVGYWLGAQARGAGHATRAVRLVCRWGIRALELERIDCLVATSNPASQHVAERAGFRREAVLRAFMPGAMGRLDMVAYGLLATDLAAA